MNVHRKETSATQTNDTVRGDPNFQRLWAGLAVSQFGSAIGMVALPVIAVLTLGASTLQVSFLVATTAITIALLAFPMGTYVEQRRKRPVMISADCLRFAALASIPLTGYLGYLSFAQLYIVGGLNAIGQIAFQAASQAHLKALVSATRIVDANGRLESTQWLSLTVGPSVGGGLVGALGPLGALIADSLSFVVSAVAIRSIRKPEPLPAHVEATESRRDKILGGYKYVSSHPQLRWMFGSWVGFAAAVGMMSPVSILYFLKDLNFSAWQYGIILGLPSMGGFLGARLARRWASRLGLLRVVVGASLLRAPWQFLIPIAKPGSFALILCLIGTFGVLLFSGMANSAMGSFRTLNTPSHLMARVSTLWSFSTTAGQPVFILIGGLLASTIGNRLTLVIAAALMLTSSALVTLALRAAREGEGPARLNGARQQGKDR